MRKDDLNTNLFEAFSVASSRSIHSAVEVECQKIDYLPKQFLRTWFDPSLGGVNKDELLSWMTASLEAVFPSIINLKVRNQATVQ